VPQHPFLLERRGVRQALTWTVTAQALVATLILRRSATTDLVAGLPQSSFRPPRRNPYVTSVRVRVSTSGLHGGTALYTANTHALRRGCPSRAATSFKVEHRCRHSKFVRSAAGFTTHLPPSPHPSGSSLEAGEFRVNFGCIVCILRVSA